MLILRDMGNRRRSCCAARRPSLFRRRDGRRMTRRRSSSSSCRRKSQQQEQLYGSPWRERGVNGSAHAPLVVTLDLSQGLWRTSLRSRERRVCAVNLRLYCMRNNPPRHFNLAPCTTAVAISPCPSSALAWLMCLRACRALSFIAPCRPAGTM